MYPIWSSLLYTPDSSPDTRWGRWGNGTRYNGTNPSPNQSQGELYDFLPPSQQFVHYLGGLHEPGEIFLVESHLCRDLSSATTRLTHGVLDLIANTTTVHRPVAIICLTSQQNAPLELYNFQNISHPHLYQYSF